MLEAEEYVEHKRNDDDGLRRLSTMRDVDGAMEWCAKQSKNPTQSWYNLCQSMSRQSYGMRRMVQVLVKPGSTSPSGTSMR